jgi:hypothetical protein
MKTIISLFALSALAVTAFAQCETGTNTCGADTKKCCKVEAAEKQMAAEGMKPFDAKDAEFLAMARKMMGENGKSCGEQSASCGSKSQAAKFKVFVAGEGYQFFGCQGSASKGRTDWVAKGARVGKIQKVTSKRTV